MLKKFTILIMATFILTLTGIVLYKNINKPRILVLHSYSDDYVWTRQINVGLDRVFGKVQGVDIRYHEMRTKKMSGKGYKHRAGIAGHSTIELIRPNVIIAVDDDAQKYVAKQYVNNPDIKIVFAGINGSPEPYGYLEANNVTGILERKPAVALSEFILLISESLGIIGQKPKAIFLADESHSTERDGDYLDSIDWVGVDYLGRHPNGTFDDWQSAVKNMKGKADFILVGGYRKLHKYPGSAKFVNAKEVMTWTEANSPVPVIGMNTFNSEEGAMLSVGVSPYEQGEVAASMAIKLIEGVDIKSLPIQTSSQYVIAMRQSALDARNISVPKIFETLSRATNNYFN
tara:strand:- start:97 stop:1131 length:1035 start_codon:yes stop_codon:yes gene_type:complete